jgi:hypothetical protein
MPWDGVCKGTGIGDDALPGETFYMEALLQREHFHEKSGAVAAAWPAHTAPAQEQSLIASKPNINVKDI